MADMIDTKGKTKEKLLLEYHEKIKVNIDYYFDLVRKEAVVINKKTKSNRLEIDTNGFTIGLRGTVKIFTKKLSTDRDRAIIRELKKREDFKFLRDPYRVINEKRPIYVKGYFLLKIKGEHEEQTAV